MPGQFTSCCSWHLTHSRSAEEEAAGADRSDFALGAGRLDVDGLGRVLSETSRLASTLLEVHFDDGTVSRCLLSFFTEGFGREALTPLEGATTSACRGDCFSVQAERCAADLPLGRGPRRVGRMPDADGEMEAAVAAKAGCLAFTLSWYFFHLLARVPLALFTL